MKKKEEEKKSKISGLASGDIGLILDSKELDDHTKMKAIGVPIGFQSTKGKFVPDARCHAHAARIKSQRQYRQYMNRRGGFNRPLDAVH